MPVPNDNPLVRSLFVPAATALAAAAFSTFLATRDTQRDIERLRAEILDVRADAARDISAAEERGKASRELLAQRTTENDQRHTLLIERLTVVLEGVRSSQARTEVQLETLLRGNPGMSPFRRNGDIEPLGREEFREASSADTNEERI